MQDFRNQIRNAVLGYLKERGHVNVTEKPADYVIFLRSMQGPPFKLICEINVGQSQLEFVIVRKAQRVAEIRTIDLADPKMFEYLEEIVQSLLD